jgi:predicted extracellular nuclease
MSLRLATFNVENLMSRFDFSGYRNELFQDRALKLYQIDDKKEYELLEKTRAVAHTDDARQLTALAISEARADIFCLQEVENSEALGAFEYGYLFKMMGKGFRRKYITQGNDSRGIDVALMMRDETRDGQKIEFVSMTSNAHLTYDDMGLHNSALSNLGLGGNERIFKRDCLEIDITVGGIPLTLFLVHFKSMGGARNGEDGRDYTMPIRVAEAGAVRRIVTERFGKDKVASKRWAICGDFNDYRERIVITGDKWNGYGFEPVRERHSCVDVLLESGFSENVVERLDPMQRWTLFHTRGPDERHLCQLDYILLSPALAHSNATTRPEIIRGGQPFRTIFPPGQEVERFPRTGWDRPKASDHCPVVIDLNMV